MTGRKSRPGTEPMYSGGNRKDFPITTGYDSVKYEDFISSQLFNSENILICQSFHNGCFSGCFAPYKRYSPRPALSLASGSDNDSFLESVNAHSKGINGRQQNIYSLACDENLGFGVFFMEKYGTAQALVTKFSDIQKKWKEGFRITSCAARGPTFFIIMTKDTEEYRDKLQMCFNRNTWNKTCGEINKHIKAGYTVTGICYSTGLKRYLVVMTKIPEVQSSHYCDDTTAVLDWIEEKRHVGYHPTLIFRHPTVDKTLAVVTTDENRSESFCIHNYKLN